MSEQNSKPSKSGKYLDSETWDAMKKAGVSEQELLGDQPTGPMIFSYTRADAIADGVLVDLMADPRTAGVVREAGFKLPIVMTGTSYEAAVGTGELPSGQSRAGRLWDVLSVLHCAIRRLPAGEDRVEFKVAVDTDGQGHHKTVALWCLCGPGDDGEPVLTIMLEGED